MKGATVIQRVMVCLAVVGVCLPQLALASTPQNGQMPVTDVQLRAGGVLVGQVVTPQNVAIPHTAVALYSAGQKLKVAKTDKSGYFAFRGLQSGVYQVAAAKSQGTYRVWTHSMAPPAARAQQGALIVAGQQTVRGQNGMRSIRNFLANPIVIAGIVATAIAVPVAIHNSNRSSGS